MRPFESGDFAFMEIDLQAQTCAFWLEPASSGGLTGGPPPNSRFNYGGCFPATRHGLDNGFMTVVVKHKGVAIHAVGYDMFSPF